jgi:predicted ATPase/DNA-binding SARP family transcriptional activator
MANLALFLLGPPRIELGDVQLKLDRYKATALLAYLAMNPGVCSRNTLAGLLWPNYDQSRARAALRRILVSLNEAGLGPWLEVERESIRIKAVPDLWLDVAQFRHNLARCQNSDQEDDCTFLLAEAATLYRADFMAGFSLRDSPAFEEWQLWQTENLRRDLITLLARLARRHGVQGEFEIAITYTQRWLETDPIDEVAHRALMELYSQNGRRTLALRQYQICRKILQEELDIPPAQETTELYDHIRWKVEDRELRVEDRGLRIEGGSQFDQPSISYPLSSTLHPPSSPAPPSNLPAQPTPFIGREVELAEIARRFSQPDCRLLTLIGPGGIGKTRLAIQAAIEQAAGFADGVYFISLAPVSSPDFLIAAIANSLNLSLDGQEELLSQLLNYLRNKQMLLVMDNFEHLVRKAGLLPHLLNRAPALKILVTSQERLNLQGEWVFEVTGMPYPVDGRAGDIESYGAVALFLQRAYRLHSGFSLTDADKPYLARICQLLKGVPLGIELAAGWVRVLSCREISQEIERMYRQPNLDFLATSLQDVPQRHQSLRDIFEHSWQLLSAAEKSLFRKMSVFRAGASRPAIEAVAEAPLALLSALIDKSLLNRTAAGRYEMHELLRQYAAEKLQETPLEAELVQDRHCAYYAAFLQEREGRLKGAEQLETLAEIGGDIENIRAGWRWAIAHEKPAEIGRASEGLWYFYSMYSWFQEGVETFGRALAAMRPARSPEDNEEHATLIGRLLAYLGWFYLRQGLYEQARDLLEQSIAILQQPGDQANLASPLNHLGILAGETGKLDEAMRLLRESMAIYRQADNHWGVAWSLSSLAHYIGELDPNRSTEAKQLLQESLAVYQALGNKHGIAIALNNLGLLAYKTADYTTARQLLQKSLALRREIGFPRGVAVALNNLGHVTTALKEYEPSKAYYYEALQIARDIQTTPLTLEALGGLAVVFANESRLEQALELLELVLAHPASNKETRDRAGGLLGQLRGETTPIRAIVSARAVEAVVGEVLEKSSS